MMKLLIALLGALLISLLAYFCFLDKKESVQTHIVDNVNLTLQEHGMLWAKVENKGEDFETTRIVVLTGEAPSEAKSKEAERLAAIEEGVYAVDNRLLISTQIEDKPKPIQADANAPYLLVADRREDGKMLLSGVVEDVESHDRLVEYARNLMGADEVVDNLRLKSGVPEQWEESAKEGLLALSLSKSADVRLHKDGLDITAKVENKAIKTQLLSNLKTAVDSHYVINSIIEVDTTKREEVSKIVKPIKVVKKLDQSGDRTQKGVQEVLSPLACAKQFQEQLDKAPVYFVRKTARFKTRSLKTLDTLTDIAKRCPKSRLRIGAHTNSIGKRAFNQSLSQERAKKVREYLIAKGVDKSRLLAVGYGEGKPLVKAKTKQALQKNQRIEVVVTSLDKEEKKSQTVLAKKAVKETPTMRSSKGCQKSFTKIMSHNKIQFQYGKSLIKKRSYRLLDDLVKVAKECEKSQLIIAGHTDASGSRRMNKNLSQKRADAVRVYLIKSGIEAGRLKAIGYGEIKPIASNKTRLGRAQNRRIEFMIKKEK